MYWEYTGKIQCQRMWVNGVQQGIEQCWKPALVQNDEDAYGRCSFLNGVRHGCEELWIGLPE